MNGVVGGSHGAESDALSGAWIAALYGSIVVPYVGTWIIVILSSVMYYMWKGTLPQKAAQVNGHGWLAWLIGQIVWGTVYYLSLKRA
jgi:hypothetical protein